MPRSTTISPPVPLGSLTQLDARSVTACPSCGSTRTTQIRLTLTDASDVDFLSCRQCEFRSWTEDGHRLAIGAVLDRTRKR
ncbi:MAG: hypothetical protein ACYCXA_02535 [Actinomycetes bacterium]